jgi:hypothetical protein
MNLTAITTLLSLALILISGSQALAFANQAIFLTQNGQGAFFANE